jgi:DNA-binding transcriptional regulator YiaG
MSLGLLGVATSAISRLNHGRNRGSGCKRSNAETIVQQREGNGVETRGRLTAVDVVEIRHARAGGVTLAVLAGRFGVSTTTVHRVAAGLVWAHAGGPTTARRRYRRLSPGEVGEIRRRRAAGERVCDLAGEFGVSSSCVYALGEDCSWRGQRFSAGPLVEAMEGRCVSAEDVGVVLGVRGRTVRAWVRDGIPGRFVDVVADWIGDHPGTIWAEYWN